MRESQILHDVRLALGRIQGLTIWRNSVGVGATGTRYQRYGLCVGSTDLIGIMAPTGRMFCLEIKSARGRLTRQQRMFASLIRSHGGFCAVARTVHEAQMAVNRARAGEYE